MFHETFNSDSISSEQSPDSLCSGESDAQETQSVAKKHTARGESQSSQQEYQETCYSVRADNIEDVKRLENFPSDRELRNYMLWRRQHSGKEAYRYWVSNPPTKEDLYNLRPSAAAAFYGQLADFVTSKISVEHSLKFVQPILDETSLEKFVSDYRRGVVQKSENFQALVAESGYPEKIDQSFKLSGLNLQIGEKSCDLVAEPWGIDGFLANILMFQEGFIWHVTADRVGKYFAETDYRVYLNPQIDQAISMADKLTSDFQNRNLPIMTKILNRSVEVAGKQHISTVRSEGLIVYASENEINEVIEVILNCYQQDFQAFANRRTPKLAAMIAPGIAVATNQNLGKKTSFNRHRTRIIESAWEAFELQSTPSEDVFSVISQEEIETFKRLLKAELSSNQVDIRNISFPDNVTPRD